MAPRPGRSARAAPAPAARRDRPRARDRAGRDRRRPRSSATAPARAERIGGWAQRSASAGARGEPDVDPLLAGRACRSAAAISAQASASGRAQRVDEAPQRRARRRVQAEQPAGAGRGAGRPPHRRQEQLAPWEAAASLGTARAPPPAPSASSVASGRLRPRRLGDRVEQQRQQPSSRGAAAVGDVVVAVRVDAVVAGRRAPRGRTRRRRRSPSTASRASSRRARAKRSPAGGASASCRRTRQRDQSRRAVRRRRVPAGAFCRGRWVSTA